MEIINEQDFDKNQDTNTATEILDKQDLELKSEKTNDTVVHICKMIKLLSEDYYTAGFHAMYGANTQDILLSTMHELETKIMPDVFSLSNSDKLRLLAMLEDIKSENGISISFLNIAINYTNESMKNDIPTNRGLI